MSEDFVILALVAIYVALFALGTAIYLIPTFIAFRREHPNRWLIMAVNVFLGGTGIGWGVALVWALRIVHLPSDGVGLSGGESGLNLFANDVKRMRIEPTMTNANAAAAAGSASTDDALNQIERLRQLFDDGHIDHSEFVRLKQAILQRVR